MTLIFFSKKNDKINFRVKEKNMHSKEGNLQDTMSEGVLITIWRQTRDRSKNEEVKSF